MHRTLDANIHVEPSSPNTIASLGHSGQITSSKKLSSCSAFWTTRFVYFWILVLLLTWWWWTRFINFEIAMEISVWLCVVLTSSILSRRAYSLYGPMILSCSRELCNAFHNINVNRTATLTGADNMGNFWIGSPTSKQRAVITFDCSRNIVFGTEASMVCWWCRYYIVPLPLKSSMDA